MLKGRQNGLSLVIWPMSEFWAVSILVFLFFFFFFLLSIDYQRRDMYGRLDHESSADGLANIQTTADMDSWGDD